MTSSDKRELHLDFISASDICSSIFDGTHDSPKQQVSGFKLVTSRHIKNNMVLKDEAYFITEEDYLKINKRSGLKVGDVLFTMIGTVGEVCRITSEPDFAIKNIGVFRPKEIKDSVWIYYYLISPEGRKNVESSKRGTTQQFMGLKELREFPIIFPRDTLYRQNQSQILELLDSKISVNNALSKTLEDIAQTIFRSWFIDFDPVKAKMNGEKPIGMDDETAALFPDSFAESELGLIPKGWKTINLSDIAYIFQGKYVKPSELNLTRNVDFPTPVEGATKSIGFTNKSTFQFDYPTVSCRGSCGYVRWISSPAWISNNLMAIYSKEQELYNYYLYFLMKTINFENITTGSVQGQITIRNLAPTKLIYQPEIVKTFSELVEPFQKTIMKLEYQSKLYADVRDSLLPRLISGELEIPEEMLAS